MRVTALAAAICAAGLLGPAAGAGPVSCPGDGRVSVDAPGPDATARACAVVARARAQLAACHLVQTRPLEIAIVPEIAQPLAGCMGAYYCREDRIAVTGPDALPGVIRADSIWARIGAEALFDSLIVHELSHAFLDQSECRGIPCNADHEYIAYAMQIAALGAADRAAVLEGHEVPLPVDVTRLNDFVVMVAPNRFAQAAWLHFSAEGNGCDFVDNLIRGDTTLWQDPF